MIPVKAGKLRLLASYARAKRYLACVAGVCLPQDGVPIARHDPPGFEGGPHKVLDLILGRVVSQLQ